MNTLINSILRLVQLFLVLIATALLGNVRATTRDAASSATAAINFSIFVAALSWIAVLYNLIAHFVSAIAIPIVALALDSAATLFTFISAVVLSAKLTTANCANPVSIEKSTSYKWPVANMLCAFVGLETVRLDRLRFRRHGEALSRDPSRPRLHVVPIRYVHCHFGTGV